MELPYSAAENKQIFILAGQSNMSGRGGVGNKHKQWDGFVPPDSASDSILRLNADLRWEAAREPLHQQIDGNRVCGVGPGMSFANALKERVGPVVVGLVPCAVAGTAIKDWATGTAAYDGMLRRAKAALADGGEIKAVLWYQGEKDTFTEEDANVYRENTERLIANVRRDLGSASLPFFLVALASGRGYLEKVRKIQKEEINLPNVVCVDAMGLQLQEDNLHLTTEAQVQLGRMLAEAYRVHFLG